jgi:Zn-dependent M28 family amino/carboxypeptidase
MSKYRLTFERKIVIAAFSGEEQGLLGSQWFAKKLKEEKEDVVLMVQADMVGKSLSLRPEIDFKD